MDIGTNRTRYSSEDLKRLADEVEALCKRHAGLARLGYSRHNRHPRPIILNIGYWTAGGERRQRWWDVHSKNGYRTRSLGPWFTNDQSASNSSRLLISTPSRVLSLLPGIEAIANAPCKVAPPAVKTQIALFLAQRGFGYGAVSVKGTRQNRQYTTDARFAEIIEQDPVVSALDIRILKNVVNPRPAGPSKDYTKELHRVFRSGKAAQALREARGGVGGWASVYRNRRVKTEEQRQRLIDRGETVEAYPTTVEMLKRILAGAERVERAEQLAREAGED